MKNKSKKKEGLIVDYPKDKEEKSNKGSSYEEEQEPSLPIFKHKNKKERYGTDSDGLEGMEKSAGKRKSDEIRRNMKGRNQSNNQIR